MVRSVSDTKKPDVGKLKISKSLIVQYILKNELTPKQEIAVQECLLKGRTFQSLADELGVNKSTVYRNYYRGLKKLIKYARYTTMKGGIVNGE